LALANLYLARRMRIPTIVTTRSDGSRPPVPIDRDQCDGAVRCICWSQGSRLASSAVEAVPVVNRRNPRALRSAPTA